MKFIGTITAPSISWRSRVTWAVAFIATFFLVFSFFHSQISAYMSDAVSQIRSHACLDVASGTHEVVFDDHEEFQSLSDEGDWAWDNMFTPNGGVLYINDDSGRRAGFGISMFHQLHCLQMVRFRLQMLTQENNISSPYHMAGLDHEHLGKHHDMSDIHMLHCLDYVRQVRD
jgi:hypothetical protein